MARLPQPGSDDNIWAELLNEYLLVSHNPDGTQRTESIPAHSVTLWDLDVKNATTQDISDLVLTNEDDRLVWKDVGSVLRAKSRLRVNVLDFGAKGDGVTDDTAAIQAAIDSVENGGVIEVPRGTYKVTTLKVRRHGITITGEARWGSRIARLSGSEPLIDFSGSFSVDGHVKFGSLTNIMLTGDYQPGVLLRVYFADNFVFRDVSFRYANGTAMDFVEVWDTRFYNCSWENCGSVTEPATLFRNSLPKGTFGYGEDNCNQIHFLGCRWEGFRNGAIRLHGAANGSPHLLNGFFFVSCKMESRRLSGSAFQIMPGSTLIYVSQLYMALMAADPDIVKPLDAIEDWGTHVFMTDIYMQWGAEVNLANSLVHIFQGGPHMYHKLSTYYPTQDPIEAAVIAEPESSNVFVACHVTNRGRRTKGEVSEDLSPNPSVGITLNINKTGIFRVRDDITHEDLFKIDNNDTRPAIHALNAMDIVGYADNYKTESWRIIGSTGSARFAGGKFKIDGAKGYIGLNTAPYDKIAMLIKPAQEGDRGLAIVRPTNTSNLRLLEFQDQTYNIQGIAIDSHGRPLAVGTPPVVTGGQQVSYANPMPQVRDIAGSISAAVKPSPTAPGTIATVTFSRPFASPPLFITIADHSAVAADLYISARSETSFTVSTRKALQGGAILNFNYSVIG